MTNCSTKTLDRRNKKGVLTNCVLQMNDRQSVVILDLAFQIYFQPFYLNSRMPCSGLLYLQQFFRDLIQLHYY